MRKYHYVYKITYTHTGEYYLGVRTSRVRPSADPYKGSGQWAVLMKKKYLHLDKEIIKTFTNRIDAEHYERRLLKKHDANRLCMNVEKPSSCRARLRAMHAAGEWLPPNKRLFY